MFKIVDNIVKIAEFFIAYNRRFYLLIRCVCLPTRKRKSG